MKTFTFELDTILMRYDTKMNKTNLKFLTNETYQWYNFFHFAVAAFFGKSGGIVSSSA